MQKSSSQIVSKSAIGIYLTADIQRLGREKNSLKHQKHFHFAWNVQKSSIFPKSTANYWILGAVETTILSFTFRFSTSERSKGKIDDPRIFTLHLTEISYNIRDER